MSLIAFQFDQLGFWIGDLFQSTFSESSVNTLVIIFAYRRPFIKLRLIKSLINEMHYLDYLGDRRAPCSPRLIATASVGLQKNHKLNEPVNRVPPI